MNKININTLAQALVKHHNENTENGICIINARDKEKFIPYKSLYEKALKVLYNLQSLGIDEGTELILQIGDDKNEYFIYTFWACILGKIIPVPVSVGFRENLTKILRVFKTLKNPRVIIDDKCYAALNELEKDKEEELLFCSLKDRIVPLEKLVEDNGYGIIKKSNENDIAYIQFSSGATGDCKGVVLTNKNLITNIGDIIANSNSTKEDSTLSWMPLTHDMGMIGFHLYPLVYGINQFIMKNSLFIRGPILWMEKINEHRATIAASSNFGLRYFLDNIKRKEIDEWDLSCIRKIYNGAEPISIEIINEFITKLKKYGLSEKAMYPVYGMAEASLAVAFPDPNKKFETITVRKDKLGIGDKVIEFNEKCENKTEFIELVKEGNNLNNCSIRITGKNNEIYGEDIVGYVHIKGDNVTKQYYNNYNLTKKNINEEGWLNTTDLGFVKDNKLVLIGRSQDLININGTSYYAHNIEKECEILDNIDTGRIAVCSHNNSLIIFILFKRKIEDFIKYIEDIKSFIKGKYAVDIKHVIPVKYIPKTTSGKIQRYKLSEMYYDGEFSDVINEIANLI
ncbi:AMP-binding protein [Clostridium hydrogenum]|uniref:AMP-binding protein n=1 Tax=Clostridium hydrogenum TaxID=2855764 RepID=UPI001F2B19D4|nr:AMP-binding protein [Clostridium hydrogenum]